MDRRAYLRWCTVAGTGILAGCSALRNDDGPAAEFTPRSSDYLAAAVGKINTAALALEEFQDGGDPREKTFDETGPAERIEEARQALSRAEGRTDGPDEADIQAVRTYATAVGKTVEAVVGLLAASDRLEDVKANTDGTEMDIETVQESISQAKSASTEAVGTRDDALAASDDVDADRLATLDAEFRAARDGVERVSGYVTGVDGLARGYDEYLDGIERLQDAEEMTQEGSSEETKTAFVNAADDFESAEGTFADAQAKSPEEIVSDLEVGRRRSVSLRHFSAGNVNLIEGRSAADAATAEVENGAYDAARESLETGNEFAHAASESFETGIEADTGEFDEEFDTATNRAGALDVLTGGYATLLDALEFVEEGESALYEKDFDAATAAFQDAGTESTTAKERFEDGTVDDGSFADRFDRAVRNARAVGALSEGYTHVAAGSEAIDAGRGHLDDREFDAATEAFGRARDSFGQATRTFKAGQAAAGSGFSEEFARARCQVEHLDAAAGHLESATEAARDLEFDRFETERDDAEAELDRAEEC